MHVHVHPVLSGGAPNIDTDVVAVRRMICRNLAVRAIKKGLYFGLLLGGHVKKFATCRRGITRTCPEPDCYYRDEHTRESLPSRRFRAGTIRNPQPPWCQSFLISAPLPAKRVLLSQELPEIRGISGEVLLKRVAPFPLR